MRPLTHSSLAARSLLVSVVVALGGVTGMAATPPPQTEEAVHRVLTLLAAVGEEYREGVHNGEVVRPIEWEEARDFFDDARQRLHSLPADAVRTPEIDALLTALAADITAKAAPEAVAEKLARLRDRLVTHTGVNEEVYPASAPSAFRGAQLFAQYCVTCHGERGDGKGPNAAGLNPPPANFTDPQFIRAETPYDFYHVISLGKRNTAMPAWDGVLSLEDRWDLVSYLWTLAPGTDGLAEGQGIYLLHCASCHSPSGNGQGPWSATLMKAVPDLSLPQSLARRSDVELQTMTSAGVAGTGMPAFERVLRDDELWKAVAFMRLLSLGGPQNPGPSAPGGTGGGGKRLAGLLRLLGQEYQRAWNGGAFTSAADYEEATALAGSLTEAAGIVADDVAPTAPDVAAKIRGDAAAIATLVREKAPASQLTAATEALAAVSESPSANVSNQVVSMPNAAEVALAEAGRQLDAALAAYGRGDRSAATVAGEAYLQFEPLEQRLGATDPNLKTTVEERFLRVRQVLRNPGNDAEARALAAAIRQDFIAVRHALQPHASRYALFLESATIILREGLEIVLVIGALLAYVVKAGNPAMRRSIHIGTGIGVIASLATAFVMGEVLRLHPSSSDLLEGVTMLLAAVVLFWVSYWLISKAEADKWQRYIRGKVQHALSGGRSVALAGAAFLAVYREGFETVLFYQALYASAPGAAMTVSAGFGAGALALALVYTGLRRFQIRIPIRQFFFVTGMLLYAMAAIFAGQGVHELQEAGVFPVTPVQWVPVLPLLGLYPSLESLAAQAVFITLLMYASLISLRRVRTATADTTAVELRALCAAIEALREEIEHVRQSATNALPVAVGERVEGLLARVEELAGGVRGKDMVHERKH